MVGGVDRPDPDFGGGAGFPVVVVVVVVDELDGDDVPAEDLGFGVVVGVVDFGRVVVVVVAADFDVDPVEPEDFIVVVVVGGAFGLDGFDPAGFDPGGFDVVVVTGARGFGGVPRDGFDVEPLAVVVVVDDLAPGLAVVVVVEAFGAFGSSLAGASSRAWVGPTRGAPAGGATAGGGIRSSRRAYCMIRAKTGADTWPP